MKKFSGTVVSAKMKHTTVVKVDVFQQHPLYKKRVKHSKKYLVHDEQGAKVGDKVIFVETRPISRHKKWKISQIIKKQ